MYVDFNILFSSLILHIHYLWDSFFPRNENTSWKGLLSWSNKFSIWEFGCISGGNKYTSIKHVIHNSLRSFSWAIKSSFNHAYMSNYMSNKTTIFTLYSWHACNMGQNRCIDHDWRCTHLKGLSLTKCLQLKMREDKLVSLVLIGIITGANTCTSVISCRYNLSWMNYCIR